MATHPAFIQQLVTGKVTCECQHKPCAVCGRQPDFGSRYAECDLQLYCWLCLERLIRSWHDERVMAIGLADE